MASLDEYYGDLLRVDLTERKSRIEKIDPDLVKKYIGGIGLNSYFLYKELPYDCNPFSPDNLLMLGVGPLVGSGAPGSDRVELSAKSPINNGFGSANAGCFLGVEIRKAGFSQVIIKGKASKPVYMFVNDQQVSLKDACHLWGLNTWDTHDAICRDLGTEDVHIMCIGPAGENKVLYSNVQSDKYLSFSRGGLGAVMGSKNLKAIVFKGSNKIPLYDRDKIKTTLKECISRIKQDPLFSAMQKYGTMLFIAGEVALNGNVSAEYFYNNIKEKSVGCYSCPMKCSHIVKVDKGPYKGMRFRGGEVAPVRAFGGPCGLDDFDLIIKCSEMCSKLGIEMLALGGTIGWAMECYKNGLITTEDTEGLELNKGNGKVVLELIDLISSRKGFGDILANGSQKAAEQLGKGTDKYLINVKGLECQVDPRPLRPGWAWCFAQAVGARSDSAKIHPLLDFPDSLPPKTFNQILGREKSKEALQELAEWFAIDTSIKKELFGEPPIIKWKTSENKALMTKWAEELSAVIDALGVCKRFSMDLCVPIGGEHYAELLSAAIGYKFDYSMIMKIGERIINLQRLFIIREQKITRKDDYFTPIVYEEALNNQRYPKEEFENVLDEYYHLRGWDSNTGMPTLERVTELELETEFDRLTI